MATLRLLQLQSQTFESVFRRQDPSSCLPRTHGVLTVPCTLCWGERHYFGAERITSRSPVRGSSSIWRRKDHESFTCSRLKFQDTFQTETVHLVLTNSKSSSRNDYSRRIFLFARTFIAVRTTDYGHENEEMNSSELWEDPGDNGKNLTTFFFQKEIFLARLKSTIRSKRALWRYTSSNCEKYKSSNTNCSWL